ncbi:MAG: hypothetical protein JWM57_1908, partial [Phycisphaerales bacterium]|nr:hypothetical protein [Phycisphaerales bacterium]
RASRQIYAATGNRFAHSNALMGIERERFEAGFPYRYPAEAVGGKRVVQVVAIGGNYFDLANNQGTIGRFGFHTHVDHTRC